MLLVTWQTKPKPIKDKKKQQVNQRDPTVGTELKWSRYDILMVLSIALHH